MTSLMKNVSPRGLAVAGSLRGGQMPTPASRESCSENRKDHSMDTPAHVCWDCNVRNWPACVHFPAAWASALGPPCLHFICKAPAPIPRGGFVGDAPLPGLRRFSAKGKRRASSLMPGPAGHVACVSAAPTRLKAGCVWFFLVHRSPAPEHTCGKEPRGPGLRAVGRCGPGPGGGARPHVRDRDFGFCPWSCP